MDKSISERLLSKSELSSIKVNFRRMSNYFCIEDFPEKGKFFLVFGSSCLGYPIRNPTIDPSLPSTCREQIVSLDLPSAEEINNLSAVHLLRYGLRDDNTFIQYYRSIVDNEAVKEFHQGIIKKLNKLKAEHPQNGLRIYRDLRGQLIAAYKYSFRRNLPLIHITLFGKKSPLQQISEYLSIADLEGSIKDPVKREIAILHEQYQGFAYGLSYRELNSSLFPEKLPKNIIF